MAQFIFGLSVILAMVTGWYAKAHYDYTKTPQEDLAMGYEIKWDKYGTTVVLLFVLTLALFICGTMSLYWQ